MITVSQWADMFRQIATEFAAEPGKWHTDKFDPMREVMDECSPHSKHRRVVLVKPVQSGGSEACVLNPIGYTIDINPRSMLVVFPTLDACESFSKERIEPMIANTSTLKDKVVDTSSSKGGAASTVKKKKYPGGFANFVGANSATGLSSRPVPIVIVDEVDLCIKNANRQGNPVKLALSRTTTFFDRKEILLSSPSNDEGESGIIPFWEDGTQGKLERECPNISCRHYQVLDFDRMDLDSAMLACEKCGQYFPEWKWQRGIGFYRWVHARDHSTTASYWISGLDSPWLDWKVDMVDDYLSCKKVLDAGGDDSLMRVFVNTKLTKYYKRRGKKIDIDLYSDRREVYSCHSLGMEVPDDVVIITAGVDVQDSFIVYDVVGWARDRESFSLETGSFQGDPRIPNSEVWQQLDNFVYRRLWRYRDGSYIRTRITFIDSGGHCTNDVYKYCKSRHPRVFAIKGVESEGTSIIVSDRTSRKARIAEGIRLVKVGSNYLKDEIQSRIAIEKPGPGYCHWPKLPNNMDTCGYTIEYFEELTSNQREVTFDKSGFAKFKWTKNRTDQDEALSCQIYARAALEYLKVKLDKIEKGSTKIQLQPSDIEEVEIGLGKLICIDRTKQKVRKAINQYGQPTNQAIMEIGEIEQEARREHRELGKVRGYGFYGAGNNTSF
jgi:phage terminase large subunit GpA-like protein